MKIVPHSLTRSVARTTFRLKRNSPHIFFAGGVVGMVGSTVLACRATLKLEPVLDDIKTDLAQAKSIDTDVNQKPYAKELIHVYGRSAKKLGALYGPSVLLGVASVGALTGSHVQLTRRNSALTATVAAVSKAFEDYRERVREELGEEKELDIYRAVREETLDIDGKKSKEKVADPNKWSAHARIFDESNPNWTKDPELNRLFVQCQQNYANHKLRARGHVFLNEIYDALGFERSQAGSILGWIMDGEGDNYIDFGIFEAYSAPFVNGIERSVILDFNVDGVIYNKI